MTNADLAGTYVRSGGGIKDSLILQTNGTFVQNITYTNGSNWSTSGTWIFQGEIVDFKPFYSAFDFEHKTIVVPPKDLFSSHLWVVKLFPDKIKLKHTDYEPILGSSIANDGQGPLTERGEYEGWN